jgi:2,3-diaminopropionate biosynthesis protein SbnA
MIFQSPEKILLGQYFLAVKNIAPHIVVNIKLEGLSITGSIKVKSALHMINKLEQSGKLRPGMRVVESSSGNLGLALSMICAAKGYKFTCVTDPNISSQTANMIRIYGGKLIVVKKRDKNGGYLSTRIDLIKSMLNNDDCLVWINQYENDNNVDAHYRITGPEILQEFPTPNYVFIGAGTTGTLGGVSKYIREHSPNTEIIAVDSVGSVTFGTPPGKRHIPGLGTSKPPYIRKFSDFDQLLMINEIDTINMCHDLAEKGIFLGGSSGTVLSGVKQYAHLIPVDSCVVAISPDMGDRYIDTVYNKQWVKEKFTCKQESLALLD